MSNPQFRNKTMLLLDIYDGLKEPPTEDIWGRFTPKLIITSLDDCWFWDGAYARKSGSSGTVFEYAAFGFGGRTYDVQRVWGLWMFGAQAIRGLVMDHYECNDCRCVNPNHLRLVTVAFNSNRPGSRSTTAKNAAKTHCKNGHELTEENCIPSEWQNRGRRICAICRRDWNNKHNTKKVRVALDASIPPEELVARIKNGRSHCPEGHELTADNCVLHELRLGTKVCKICRKKYHQERYLAQQEKKRAHIANYRGEQLRLPALSTQSAPTDVEF